MRVDPAPPDRPSYRLFDAEGFHIGSLGPASHLLKSGHLSASTNVAIPASTQPLPEILGERVAMARSPFHIYSSLPYSFVACKQFTPRHIRFLPVPGWWEPPPKVL